MRLIAALALIALLTACSGSSDAKNAPALSAKQAVDKTCTEVRAGIADFNNHDYQGTVDHFTTARTTAKVYAKVSPEPEADALLDAVEYYANLAPADYPDAARTSESFARSKKVTLTQCASDDTSDGVPTQST